MNPMNEIDDLEGIIALMKSGKDHRGIIEVDPNVELQDYSGPFKADLRYTNFSRAQLARMYLMACEYFVEVMLEYNKWIAGKYGFQAMTQCQHDLWGENALLKKVFNLKGKWMNIQDRSIEGFMKDLQIDTTSTPGRFFDITYEMPSKDRGIITFHRCICVDMYEPLGLLDKLKEHCEQTCPDSFIRTAPLYHPDMRVKVLAIPPRKSKDDICCKWELYYDATQKEPITWFNQDERDRYCCVQKG